MVTHVAAPYSRGRMSLLLFKKGFLNAIRTGEKRTTIRRWNKPRVRAGGRAFSPGIGWISIEDIEEVNLADLNECDERADGFHNAAQMRKELGRIYPNVKADGKCWFRVRFRIATMNGEVTR